MVIIILIALLTAGAGVGAMFHKLKSSVASSSNAAVDTVREEIALKKGLVQRIQDLLGNTVGADVVKEAAYNYRQAQEKLKAERGRITITQAELETVETRLRELEEIERELEASGLETKEELNILQRKQADLASKNSAVKTQIEESQNQWTQLVKEMESNSQVAERVQAAQNELVSTEGQIATLMLQIEQGNDQYFILKRRYDALDIEYAQLYEKFSEAEAMVTSAKDNANG